MYAPRSLDAGGLLTTAGIVEGLRHDTTALRAPAENAEADTWAALALAEMLGIPLVTKHPEIRSRKIPVLHS